MEEPLEIEIKLKVNSHSPFFDAIKEFANDSPDVETNHDFYLDNGSLFDNDKFLRIRYFASAKDTVVDDQVWSLSSCVTYKGPKKIDDSGVLLRTEYNIPVDNENAKNILGVFNALGYNTLLEVKKSRRIFRVNNCLVLFDIVQDLGFFIEIEGPSVEEVNEILFLFPNDQYEIMYKGYAQMAFDLKQKDNVHA